jgi:hypothetical protein
LPSGWDAPDDATVEQGQADDSSVAEDLSLEDLATQLERDPDECGRAFQGLESVEVETRLRIIAGLGRLSKGQGIARLLRLLGTSGDPATRQAARAALDETDESTLDDPSDLGQVRGPAGPGDGTGSSREVILAGEQARPRLSRCLVTAVDGSGRGSIVLSTSRAAERHTAAFLCDVRSGIVDVLVRVEAESAGAGRLVEEVRGQAGVDAIEGVAELALRLLAGGLMLSTPKVAAVAADWLERTLGGGFASRPFPVPPVESGSAVIASSELLRRAGEVLDACPTWLDDSPLTFELAEEILLREGRVAADPRRDSGAFRFWFEHRFIHRLELYRRMLLWMAWFWTFSGEAELAASARILAWQLSDEQYAVPSHPFAVALTARSLDAAQGRLGGEADRRSIRGDN